MFDFKIFLKWVQETKTPIIVIISCLNSFILTVLISYSYQEVRGDILTMSFILFSILTAFVIKLSIFLVKYKKRF